MAIPTFKTFPTIVQEMISSILTNSELTDINPGSVTRSMVEAFSAQDAEEYLQMQRVLEAFSFETASGEDLDRRVDDFDLERIPAGKALGNIQVSDTAITTEFKATLAGSHPVLSATVTINENLTTLAWPATGSLILEREDTGLRELVPYASHDGVSTFTLTGTTANAHLGGVTVIQSQQGADTALSLGTIVFVGPTSTVPRIDFETTAAGTILDGDITSADIPVIALLVGSAGNVAAGTLVNFDSLPFSTATVTNALRAFSGRELETDSELVDRLKLFIGSLSRATREAIEFAAIGITTTTQEVVSASAVDRTSTPGEVDLFIDDGVGFTPTTVEVLDEVWEEKGEPGQRRARSQFFPGTADLIRLYKSEEEGSSTSVGAGSLTDTSKAFGVDEFLDHVLTDGAGNFFKVLTHGAGDTLPLDTPQVPAAGRYAIFPVRTDPPLIEDTDFVLNRTTNELELSVAAALTADQRLATMETDPSGTPGYKYFDGLVQEVARVIMGDPADLDNFPGVAAAGIRVFVSAPTIINQSFQVSIESNIGVSESSLVDAVRSTVLNYVNGLKIGNDIILSEIIAGVQAIDGIFDVKISIPADNVTIGEGQVARTTLATITVL